MHILWTPSWYPSQEEPLNGSFFAEQRQMLIDAGHMVGVINLNTRSLWQVDKQVWKTQIENNIHRREVLTIPLELIPGDVTIIRRYARTLGKEYERLHGIPDVIHAHSAFPGILVANELSKRWKIPFGFTEHRPSSVQRNRAKGRFRAIAQAVQASSFNVTVSNEMARMQGAFYGTSPFLVSALPAPAEFFDDALPDRDTDVITFLHVSHMDRNKRVEETITAFHDVRRDDPRVNLLLVGGAPSRVTELREWSRRHGGEDGITFTGQIPRQEIARHMRRGDCLVLVSEQEAGGTVMAEAQCLGMPVLASRTPAGTFMVEPQTGLVVPIDDHKALVVAMKQIVSGIRGGRFNPSQIRERARQRFSAEAFVSFHEKCYSEAISQH